MYCENCGKPLAEGASVCEACGSKIESAAPEVSSNDLYSMNVGTVSEPVTAEEPVDAPEIQTAAPVEPAYQAPAYQAPVTPPKKNGKGLIIGLAIALVAVVLGIVLLISGVFGGSSSSYEDVIADYIRYYENDDPTSIAELFLPEWYEGSLAMGMTRDSFLESYDTWSTWYGDGINTWGIQSVTTMDQDSSLAGLLSTVNSSFGLDATDCIDVRVDVLYDDTADVDFDFVLVEVDGDWYLLMVW